MAVHQQCPIYYFNFVNIFYLIHLSWPYTSCAIYLLFSISYLFPPFEKSLYNIIYIFCFFYIICKITKWYIKQIPLISKCSNLIEILPLITTMYVYSFTTKANTFYFLQLFKRMNLYFLIFKKQDFKLVNIMFLSRQSHKFRSGRRKHSLTKCLAGPGTAADEMIFWRDNLLIRRLRLKK